MSSGSWGKKDGREGRAATGLKAKKGNSEKGCGGKYIRAETSIKRLVANFH